MSGKRHAAFGPLIATALAALIAGTATAAAPDLPRLPKPRPAIAGDSIPPPAVGTAVVEPRALADPVPLPRPRPATEPPAETLAWAGSVEEHFQDAQPEALAVVPEVLPLDALTVLGALETVAPLPRPRPTAEEAVLALVSPRSFDVVPRLREPADPECLANLRALGVAFTQEAPIDADGECSVDHPLNVTSLGAGVALEPESILNCRTAESLARWVQTIALPAAKTHFGEAPTSVGQDSTYVCRPRNNVDGAKLSEHAHANAVDIASIGFAKREPIHIGGGGEKETAFENEIRKGSCDYFTTVLGPGSNAAHATHLHLDMQVRNGGYRLCEFAEPSLVRAP